MIVANKVDLIGWEEVAEEDKQRLASLAKDNHGYLIKMSNKSGVGINQVKETACNILLDYRLKEKSKSSKKFEEVLNKIHVGLPGKAGGGRARP